MVKEFSMTILQYLQKLRNKIYFFAQHAVEKVKIILLFEGHHFKYK